MNLGDIATRADIEHLLTRFYDKAFNDEVIGYIFTDVVQLDLVKHLPVITDFWESVLLETGSYKRNPILPHAEIQKKTPLEHEHFTRWLKLWKETIDEHFSGEKADVAKQRADSIAMIMQVKLNIIK